MTAAIADMVDERNIIICCFPHLDVEITPVSHLLLLSNLFYGYIVPGMEPVGQTRMGHNLIKENKIFIK